MKKAQRAETGQEDTTSDYYVHPAFTNDVDLGGWDSELTGIWVGKYETSLVDTSDKNNIKNVVTDDEGTGNILLSDVENRAIAVKSGMSSWRYITIGNMYTNAKSYDENLNSHMLKNSEWGAVVYLTHSQYGRNAYEVELNDNNEYITADEGIDVNPEQSSTGNAYGIYDLAGGSYERVAAYNINGIQESKNNGQSIINEENKEYVNIYGGTDISLNYKIGDATYEVKNWNDDDSSFIGDANMYFVRGGPYGGAYEKEQSGIFFSRTR